MVNAHALLMEAMRLARRELQETRERKARGPTPGRSRRYGVNYSPELIGQIKTWHKQGMPRRTMATLLGTTPAALSAKLCALGIRYRRLGSQGETWWVEK